MLFVRCDDVGDWLREKRCRLFASWEQGLGVVIADFVVPLCTPYVLYSTLSVRRLAVAKVGAFVQF